MYLETDSSRKPAPLKKADIYKIKIEKVDNGYEIEMCDEYYEMKKKEMIAKDKEEVISILKNWL